ncbi:hypothetical protein SISNIDRAFT_467150 [Sistotremastrum niveocremeum HHB9708]|uniref:Uncharacterized protein n=1 Tax=Sistotremastrum niveocremeum HHB9708 TaxID=1314777 RepID=A0A164TEN5_9AGAM|nr:hypothetical protein SISNIDRAFT_467150 [Sistotremastrum niveocremeum HHB9708]
MNRQLEELIAPPLLTSERTPTSLSSSSTSDPSFKIGANAAFVITFQLVQKCRTYQRLSVYRKPIKSNSNVHDDFIDKGLTNTAPVADIKPELRVTISPDTGLEIRMEGSMSSKSRDEPTEIFVRVEHCQSSEGDWILSATAQSTKSITIQRVYRPFTSFESWFPPMPPGWPSGSLKLPEFFCATKAKERSSLAPPTVAG